MGDNGSKLSGVEKPALNTGGSGDLKTQKEKIEEKKDKLLATGDQIKPEQKLPTQPPTDFKVAEIWIRNGRCMIDAPPEFWQDKCRALGLLGYCERSKNAIAEDNARARQYAEFCPQDFYEKIMDKDTYVDPDTGEKYKL